MNKSEKGEKALSIISLITGIVGLLFFMFVILLRNQGFWCIVACVIFSVTGLILSAVSLRKPNGIKVLSISGMITSIVTLVLLLILFTLIATLYELIANFINAISGLGKIG